MYFVCVYPGCKTLLPKVVACEGPLIMMTGSLSPKKKKTLKKKEEKRGCSLIRACLLIRSNTVFKLYPQEEHDKRRRDMLELQRMEKEQLNFKRMREDAERAEEDEFKKQVGVVPRIARQQSLLSYPFSGR